MASGLPLDKPLIATIEQHAKILCNQRKAATQSTITIKEVRRSNDVADTVRLFFQPEEAQTVLLAIHAAVTYT